MAAALTVKILGDASGFKHAADQVEGISGKLSTGLGKIAGLAGGAFAALGAASFAKDAIGAASDLNESVSKTGVIFGDTAAEIERWAGTAAKSIGQSKVQALDAASTFATFGKSAGLTGQSLVDFATKNSQLASDLASFNNTSPEEAIEAIGAALRGESEPIRKYGVLLDDATLRQRALALGLIKTTKEALTPQQKVLAANAEIYAQTSAAQGDFARTSDGLANRQRILGAQFTDLKGRLGSGLLPVVNKVAGFLVNNMIPAFERIGKAVGPVIAEVAGGIQAFGAAFQAGGDDVTSGGFAGQLERLGLIARKVFDWLKINVPIAVAAVRQAWADAQPWIEENVFPLWEKIKTLIVTVMEAVRAVVERVIWLVKEYWERFGDDTVAAIRKAVDGGMRILNGIIDTITRIFALVKHVMKGEWGAAWDDIVAVVKHVVMDVFPALMDTWKAWFVLALKALGGLVAEAMSAVWDKMWDAGADLIEGLLDGMRSMWGTVKRWIADRAGDIPGVFKSVLGIASPSKVFAGIGENIMDGLRVGMSNVPGVPIPALAGGIGAAGGSPTVGGGAGTTVNIYAQSPEAIAEALRRYNRLNGTGWFQ